jgi:hypothetical protein
LGHSCKDANDNSLHGRLSHLNPCGLQAIYKGNQNTGVKQIITKIEKKRNVQRSLLAFASLITQIKLTTQKKKNNNTPIAQKGSQNTEKDSNTGGSSKSCPDNIIKTD